MHHKLLILAGVFALTSLPLASAASISDLTNGLNTFTTNTTKTLPFAASTGLDWSDAWIGSVADVPPHFGLGIAGGATYIPGSYVKPLVTALGGDMGGLTDVPLPFMVIDGRIGGFILPFDVGLKVGFLPSGFTVGNYGLSYQNFGFDVRYALIKNDLVWPTVSVGVGFDYFNAGMKTTYGSGTSFSDGSGNTLSVGAPTATLNLTAYEFEGKIQVSKTFLFLFTPYLGAAMSVGAATAQAKVDSTLTSSTGNLTYWQNAYSYINSSGFSQTTNASPVGFKLFGGTSVNLGFFRIDLQGLFNLPDGSYGGSLGARFQM